ncbi:MAG: DUF4249 domain-containing protein [Cyclobacteriaceae bacterium]|nr:DUF4249 domain-containing protein [Cyclobacteriaceae bacterium]
MKTSKHSYLLLIFASSLFYSCEDVIDPTLQSADPVVVVDAWINNLPGAQTITLTWTQPYFESQIPPAITGATVSVSDDQGKNFLFIENVTKPGHYEWSPSGADTLRVGGKYWLTVITDSDTFQAQSYMGRVPAIDSITYEEDENIATGDPIVRAEFWATDPVGTGDAYWIRSFKNGVPLLKPGEINIAFDAGVSIGGPTDGVMFVAPVRRRINAVDRDEDDQLLSPIENGDSMHVQIHSLTVAAFTYLNEVSIQTNRPGGFAELFATPLANVSTNILNLNTNGRKAVGFFNVSAVSAAGKRYVE